MPPPPSQTPTSLPRPSSSLVDVLDRVLDKGLVIAGDVKISVAEVELLTIRIRLLVCSIDKAEQVGLDWWKYDRHLSGGAQQLAAENQALRDQVAALQSGSRRAGRAARRRSAGRTAALRRRRTRGG